MEPGAHFDKSLVISVHSVYEEFLKLTDDIGIAIDLTQIYFAVPDQSPIIIPKTAVQLARESMEKDQVIESLTTQIMELKKRVDSLRIPEMGIYPEHFFALEAENKKLKEQVESGEELFRKQKKEILELRLVADMREYSSFDEWITGMADDRFERKYSTEELRTYWDNFRW